MTVPGAKSAALVCVIRDEMLRALPTRKVDNARFD